MSAPDGREPDQLTLARSPSSPIPSSLGLTLTAINYLRSQAHNHLSHIQFLHQVMPPYLVFGRLQAGRKLSRLEEMRMGEGQGLAVPRRFAGRGIDGWGRGSDFVRASGDKRRGGSWEGEGARKRRKGGEGELELNGGRRGRMSVGTQREGKRAG